MDPGKFLDRGEDVERLGVAVGILALGEFPRLSPALAAGQIGDELEQAVGCG